MLFMSFYMSEPSDKIFITDLCVQATIGVHPWEQTMQQPLIFNLILDTDIRAAAKTDDLAKTLDYAKICEYIESYTKENPYQLVETLAERLCQSLGELFPIHQIQLSINKPAAIPNAKGVGVSIVRQFNT